MDPYGSDFLKELEWEIIKDELNDIEALEELLFSTLERQLQRQASSSTGSKRRRTHTEKEAEAKSQEISPEIAKLRAMRESHNEACRAGMRSLEMAEAELKKTKAASKELKILMKDTSQMTETQLRYHNELCKGIRERHEFS